MSSFKVFLDRGRALGHTITSEELHFSGSGQFTAWAERVKASKGKKAVAAYFIFMLAGKNWAMANVAVQTGLVERLAAADKLVLVYAWIDHNDAFMWLLQQDPQWKAAFVKTLPLEWILNLNALNMTCRDFTASLKTVLPLVEPKLLRKYAQAAFYLG